MAAQTLTDVTRNYDDAAISGLLNGETITLNNANLIINSDVRWGQQAAVFGLMTISSTLGGSILLDGRDVWWMPFDGGTGNVPALGTAGTNDVTGSVAGAGEFLGVFTALGTAPLAAGGAMPASGFIKFRKVTSAFADNETMTFTGGATAAVNSATGGQRGWIHVVGAEAGTFTVPRLGTFQARGDWFELGQTNGADDQTFQYPILDNCPAIQIETAPGSGIYEWYLNAGSRWGSATIYVPQNVKGKYFGMDNATGVITIARRATNACGFKPASGCRVRIPNIIVSNSTATNWALNTLNATLATRYDFTTTSAGNIDIEGIVGAWFLSFTSAFAVRLVASALLQAILISNTASDTTMDNCAIGLNSTTEFNAITLSNLFSGGLIRDVRAARYASSAGSQYVFAMIDCEELDFTRVQAEMFGSATAVTRGNATAFAFSFTRANNFSMIDCSILGARIDLSQCANAIISGLIYSDMIGGNTTATNPQFAITIINASINIDINGFSNFGALTEQQPNSGLVSILNSYSVTIRNIGTSAAPYNMGVTNGTAFICSFAVVANLIFRRIYTLNTRTAPFSTVNTAQGIIMDNVWGDGADSQALACLNVTPKGCRWTYSVTPQASVYGRHWEDAFISTVAGRIIIAMNEPLAATADQAQITAGTPAFTSAGQVAMRNIGDQVTWTCPYFILGYTSLANLAPILTGTLTGNMSYEYQIDTGSGFGVYKALTGANLSGESITSSVGFRLRVRATTVTANATNALSYIAIQGVTDATAQQTQYPLPFDATASITGIIPGSRVQIYNVTTATEIKNEVVPGSAFTYGYYNGTGVTSGDVIRIRLAYVSGASARLPQEITAIASTLGFSALASQVQDTVYNTNAIDGSTVSELASDYPNIQIDSNDVDGLTTVQRIYAWFVNNRATLDGIRQYFDAILAEDLVNYRIKSSTVNLKIDNVISTPLQIIGGRIYRDDGATVIAATSNSIQIDPDKAYGVEVGTSGLTPTEADTLNKLNALTEDVSGLRFTTKALEQAPASGGGGGSSDWTATEKEQIRNRLGIDGTASAPSATPTLARPSDIPTASQNAAQVRTELTTELGRIDVATSTRLATAGYTAPPSAAAVRAEIDANSTKLDVAVGTRLSSAGYTAPANADVAAIKAKTDNLPAAPASEGSVTARPTLAQIEASTVLAKEATSQSIKTKTDALPTDPADNSQILSAISGISGGSSPSEIATAVRSELATELARVDVAISTRNATAPDNSGIAAIKAKTDNLPAAPASEGNVTAVGNAVVNVGNMVGNLPELSAIEASTVLAKESTVSAVKSKTDALPVDPASATQVNTRLASVAYTAPDNASVAAIKLKTDNLPSDPASETSVAAVGAKADAIKTNTDLIPATV
jgi:hypothetical protein